MGGVGVRRLEASANHSSEKERTLPPRAAEIRSGCIVSRNQISRGRDCGVSKKMRPEFMDRSLLLSAITVLWQTAWKICHTLSEAKGETRLALTNGGGTKSGIDLVCCNTSCTDIVKLILCFERHI
jgi:hypothetical protein